MKILLNFEDLNTFDCNYGEVLENSERRKFFVDSGLEPPSGELIGVFDEQNSDRNRRLTEESCINLIPDHYIHDPARNERFYEWEVNAGLLKARNGAGQWIHYGGRADSLCAMHEYVGGCWFVFEGVVYSSRTIMEDDSSATVGKRWSREQGSKSLIDASIKEYVLEGRIDNTAGSGWLSWEIYARSFYLEIPDI